MSDTEETRTSSPGKEPSSPLPSKADETSQDGSSRMEEDMDETTSVVTGNSSPISHAATEPTSELGPDEDFEVDTGDTEKQLAPSDKALIESNVRRRPKGAGFYRQLDEGNLALADERSHSPGAGSIHSKGGSKRHRRSATSSSTLGKATDIDPLWLVPFKYGWRRQVIIRATASGKANQDPKKSADTYYLPPTGRKLRSMPEIDKYLAENEYTTLTSANFTFRKDSIHEAPEEVVRHAAKGNPYFKKASKKDEKKEEENAKDKLNSAPEVVSVTNSVLTVHKSSDRSEGPIKTIVRAVAKKHTGKRSSHQSLFGGGEGPASKKARTENGGSTNGEQKLCSLDCAGRGGSPPSLHCEVCMCLFHPECVGFDRTQQRDGFVCKACQNVEQNLLNGRSVVKRVNVSTTPTGTPPPMPTIRPRPQAPQNMQRKPSSVPSLAPRPLSSTSLLHRPPTKLTTTAATAIVGNQEAVKIPASFDPNNISGQLITLPPSLTSKLNLTRSVNLKWNGQSYIIPPNCFISTADGLKVLLPSGTLANGNNSTSGSMSAQLNTTTGSINLMNTASLAQSTLSRPARTLGQLTSVLPSVVSTSSSSPATPRTPVVTQVIAPTNSGPPSPNTLPTSVIAISPEPSATANLSSEARRPPPLRVMSVPQCHFRKLQAGFDSMLHLFGFLPPADLLRVSQVSKSWQNAALSSSLWKRVHLRKVAVTDWKKAAAFLRLRNTQVLDLRSMRLGDEDEREMLWKEFVACLRGMMDCVRDLRLPQCPGSVIQAVTECMPHLQAVQALCITDPATGPDDASNSRVAVAKFGGLTELRELRLRGVNGIQLPALSTGGGLAELAQLKHLKMLSLTTLREVTGLQFSFLSSLTELETLELGDCYLWTQQTYEQLGELKKLGTLRLECGGDSIDGLGPALEKLTQLRRLELIRFPVNEELAGSLQKLSTLVHLSVWPDTDTEAARVNAATRTAVSNMGFLQELDWGITTTDNTLLFPDDDEENADGTAPMVINELFDSLHTLLPSTFIRVFKVPALQKPNKA